MIKETVNEYRFTQVLMADEYAKWTYGATKALFDYYDELSDGIGEEMELEAVAIRCEWSQYPSAVDAYQEYSHPDDGILDEDDAREWLEERTTVLDVENIDFSTGAPQVIKSILVMAF